MPKSTLRVSPNMLEHFLELLPQTGAVVTGMQPRYNSPDGALLLDIEGDSVPDAPVTEAIITRTSIYTIPSMTFRPYEPISRPIIKTIPDPGLDVVMSASGVSKRMSDHALDGLLPYQRHALEALEGEGKVFFPARSHSKSWLQGLFGPGKRSFSQRLRAVREKAEAEIRKFDAQSAQRNNVSKNGQQVSDESSS